MKDLWIPNPLTEQFEFFNQALKELYKSSYDLMAPLQFKQYSISQRFLWWKINKDCEKQKKKITSILDSESKDGNPINVVRYSSSHLGSIKPGDKSKAESCQKLIAKLINETEGMLKYVADLRSKFFDLKNNVK